MTDYPITPPPELVRQWMYDSNHNESMFPQVAAFAAQWGADQELEACCEWVKKVAIVQIADNLRTARRPKPLSLKEQALLVLEDILNIDSAHYNILQRALEQLND
jgi:hypothetical protein